jgi:hypothetical protein
LAIAGQEVAHRFVELDRELAGLREDREDHAGLRLLTGPLIMHFKLDAAADNRLINQSRRRRELRELALGFGLVVVQDGVLGGLVRDFVVAAAAALSRDAPTCILRQVHF